MECFVTVLHAEDGTYTAKFNTLEEMQAYVREQMGTTRMVKAGKAYQDSWGRTLYTMTIEEYQELETYPEGMYFG